jgi:hypothetical protein
MLRSRKEVMVQNRNFLGAHYFYSEYILSMCNMCPSALQCPSYCICPDPSERCAKNCASIYCIRYTENPQEVLKSYAIITPNAKETDSPPSVHSMTPPASIPDNKK